MNITPQSQIESFGRKILESAKNSKHSLLSKNKFYSLLMDFCIKNTGIKSQLFRFVEVLPMLQTGTEIINHLKEYLADEKGSLPNLFSLGLGLGDFAPDLMGLAIKKNVMGLARIFITGENETELLNAIQAARKQRKAFTLDLLGESALSSKEAQYYQKRYLELIDFLSKEAKNWETIEQCDHGLEGPLPKVNLSLKLSSLCTGINEKAWEQSKAAIKGQLRPIFEKAKQTQIGLTLDMEQYALKEMSVEVFKELLLEESLKDYRYFGIVQQAYLKSALADLKELIHFAKHRSVPFSIRLVKGAYWDSEVINARSKSGVVPVYVDKRQTDTHFEACARLLLDHIGLIDSALASHNIRSLSAAFSYAESLNISKKAFEVQMLYGMADDFKNALIEEGYRLREYMTMGDLIPGMAYLVRRLLENSSNESFLRQSLVEEKSWEELLQDPEVALQKQPFIEKWASPYLFENEPFTNFSVHTKRLQLRSALSDFNSQLGRHYPLVINKERIFREEIYESLNPSHPREVVGLVSLASEEDAQKAIQSALHAFPSWKNTSVNERALCLERLADLMVKERFQLVATQIHEVGKPWAEADADVAEAIDFCRYYALQMRKLATPQKVGHSLNETSYYHYQARGLTLVIAPWNFPLAILTGMTTAALVTGNTVIMKPSEDSSVVAAGLMDLLERAGVPSGVVHYLPCHGATVGDYLVRHPSISTIAFTGSRKVGLHIHQAASVFNEGSRHIKRCIMELGGKNAMIIDNDADMDAAIPAAAYSAMGFAGQKCSALSRAIVLKNVYESFVSRLVDRVSDMSVLPAEDPLSSLGPVINAAAQQRLLGVIEKGKKEARLVYQGLAPQEGFFVPPTIFADVSKDSFLAQEEFFGPILAIIKAEDMDEAFRIANDSDYALTGGVFSRSPSVLKRAAESFEVGNLYLNRGITGALVERHPFGGFKLSGAGSKAGGPDYLLHYMEPRVVTESTLGKGLSAEALLHLEDAISV